MPRTLLAEHLAQKKRDALIELFVGVQKTAKKSTAEVAAMAGLSRAALAARYRGDAEFKRGEIIGIGRGLKIPIEELRQCSLRY